MENRRKAVRKPLSGRVVIQSAREKRAVGEGTITDINEGGFGLIAPDILPLGDKLLFDLSMPNGWRIDLIGHIVHNKPGATAHAYGVKFAPGQDTFLFNLF